MEYLPASLLLLPAPVAQNPPHRSHYLPLVSPTAEALSARASIACSLFQSPLTLACFVFNGLQPLFTKHRGVSTRHLFQPSGPRQSAKRFASYHIPATLAVSCDYALFCATAASQTLSRQEVAPSFHRKRGCYPPRCHGTPRLFPAARPPRLPTPPSRAL